MHELELTGECKFEGRGRYDSETNTLHVLILGVSELNIRHGCEGNEVMPLKIWRYTLTAKQADIYHEAWRDTKTEED
jgi:hypothetical protein